MRPMEEIEYLNAENDALKKKIKELELANRAHLIELGNAEECFKAKDARIKDLEEEIKVLKETAPCYEY